MLGIKAIKLVKALRLKKNFLSKDVLEIQGDAIQKGQKVVVIDDLLATGGKLISTVYLLCAILLPKM